MASNGNREYKSDVFSMILENPENALQVYNSINGTQYTDSSCVELQQLNDRGFSLSVRNDTSFIIDANLSIYEHQSTVCSNMPISSFIYFRCIVDSIGWTRAYGATNSLDTSTSRFVILYNGNKELPDKNEMKLSDLYSSKVLDPKLDFKFTVYNINGGKNDELLDKCLVLREYMIFVDYVRDNIRESDVDLRGAIELAMDRCIKEGILRDFWLDNRADVISMLLLDYSFEKRVMMEIDDARTEGYLEGLAEARAERRREAIYS